MSQATAGIPGSRLGPGRFLLRDAHLLGIARNLCLLAAIASLALSGIPGVEGTARLITVLAAAGSFGIALLLWKARSHVLRLERPASRTDRAVLEIIERFSPLCIHASKDGQSLVIDLEGNADFLELKSRQIQAIAQPLRTQVRGEGRPQDPVRPGPAEAMKDMILLYRRWKKRTEK